MISHVAGLHSTLMSCCPTAGQPTCVDARGGSSSHQVELNFIYAILNLQHSSIAILHIYPSDSCCLVSMILLLPAVFFSRLTD